MTRSRAKDIHDKVNSLLSLHTFDVSVNGSLPHGDTLCMLNYEPPREPQGDAKDDQDKSQEEEKEGEEEDSGGGTTGAPSGTTAAPQAEVPPVPVPPKRASGAICRHLHRYLTGTTGGTGTTAATTAGKAFGHKLSVLAVSSPVLPL